MQDDLYCWYPGLKYSDSFSFILSIYPDLFHDYKKYYTSSLILLEKPKTRVMEVLREKSSKNMEAFDIISIDLDIFRQQYEGGRIVSRIITASYWSEEEDIKCDKVVEYFGLNTVIQLENKNIEAEICCRLSYVEIEIDGENLKVPFFRFEDLLNSAPRSVEFWRNLGVDKTEWYITQH